MAILGELEQRVMTVLWDASQPLSVRAVHTAVVADRDLAYTTVMTVLDRLAKKGIVARQLDGRAWSYTAAKSQVELVADELGAVLASCEGHESEALALFLGRLPAAVREAVTAN